VVDAKKLLTAKFAKERREGREENLRASFWGGSPVYISVLGFRSAMYSREILRSA